ncbi:subtilisin-like serine peptidase [Trypanosoma cruzi]|nr:subtilisin-like serine peptidase [Trypanosoma cruzi]
MPELEAMPSYLPDTVVLQLHRDDGEAESEYYMDANSLTFVALGDAGRPALCGIDAAAQLHHEGVQRALVSATGIVSSIRRRRLRIPFENSELSELLRRAYNTEKGNRSNSLTGSTETALLAHAFLDAVWVEESFHCFSTTRRVGNILVSTGIGSATRDLAVDKWRPDQDIMELRDELMIARTVYDHRHCGYESNTSISGIKG